MRHRKLKDDGYYIGININYNKSKVLLQLGDPHGEQIRAALTDEEAKRFGEELIKLGLIVKRGGIK